MLTEHADNKADTLSGGMKRKLSVGMSLIGNSKIIILDEPTSGLDVASRRQVWHLIQRIKEKRSIILSTQHIEEADYLSDRVCIMSHGKIIALDTPTAMKRNFGVGYDILIENLRDGDETELPEEQLSEMILSTYYVEGATKKDQADTHKLIY